MFRVWCLYRYLVHDLHGPRPYPTIASSAAPLIFHFTRRINLSRLLIKDIFASWWSAQPEPWGGLSSKFRYSSELRASRNSPFHGLEQKRNGTNSAKKWGFTVVFCLVVRNEIPSVFLFCEMVRNGIPRIFIFCGIVRNEIMKFRVFFFFRKMVRIRAPRFFYLPRNGSEQNSEYFPLRGTGGIPTEWIKIFVSSVFCEFFFLGKWQP
jgi:hypothetical protein